MRQVCYAVAALHVLLVVGGSVVGCGSANTLSPSHVPPSGSANGAGNMSVPMLDAWWDSSSAGLRIEYGVAGSASQGPPLYNDGTYSGATACVRKRIALLTTASGSLFLAQLPQGAPQLITNQGVTKAQITFSPSCDSALAFASGNPNALLIQGLLSAPKSSNVLLPENISAIVASDSGSILISVPQADGSAELQLMTSGGSAFQPFAAVSKFGGMAFMPGSDMVLFADGGSNNLVQASATGPKSGPLQIAGSADGISRPLAIGVSADGHTVAIANGLGSAIVRIDLLQHLPSSQAKCACSPAELQAMGGNAAFRLNEPGSGTVWAFDGDAPTPRIVFVPSASSSAKAQVAKR